MTQSVTMNLAKRRRERRRVSSPLHREELFLLFRLPHGKFVLLNHPISSAPSAASAAAAGG